MLGMQSLLNRLPRNHHQYSRVEEDVRRRKAGFAGVENFDKHIREFRPSYPYGLLHDICLIQDGVYFQMDSVLITPGNILIFEIKNLGGKLTVKAKPTQFIQENNGDRKVIHSPIIELERKKLFLDRWMRERGMDVPITGMVALAFTNELYVEEETNIIIASTQEIPIILNKMAIENKKWGRREISNIANEMARLHQEYNPFPLTLTMKIPRNDILSGVICPNCKRFGMKWKRRKWVCGGCTYSAVDCHIPSINDWFYLIDKKITNRDFREFTGVENRHISKRLLQNAGLELVGTRKAAKYI